MAQESATAQIEPQILGVRKSICFMAIVGFQVQSVQTPCLLCRGAKLGDDHTDTYLICLNNMALCLQDQGRLTEAGKLHREALEKSPGAQFQRFQKGLWAMDL